MKVPDPEMTMKLCQALATSSPLRESCLFAGTNPTDFHSWHARGARYDAALSSEDATAETLLNHDEEAPFLDFYRRVERARAEAVIKCTSVVYNAVRGGEWRAAIAVLERTRPEEWGRKVLQHVGPDGGAVQLDVRPIEDQLARSLAEFREDMALTAATGPPDDDDPAEAEIVED